MNINFKKLSGTAITPFKAHATDAGFDLFADEDVVIEYGETKVISTGIALELPDGYFADVRPRSGLTSKTALRVHLGTVDSAYRGDIGIICENAEHEANNVAMAATTGWALSFYNGSDSYRVTELGNTADELVEATNIHVKRGDKIAQLVIQKLPEIKLVEANELKESDRGVNGFGSTDKKED